MRSLSIIILLSICFSACRKTENHSDRYNNLLGRWRLTEFGIDSNKNGQLDSFERSPAFAFQIQESTFNADGTGVGYANFSGTVDSGYFKWYLKNNETILRTVTNEGRSQEVSTEQTLCLVTSQSWISKTLHNTDTLYGVYTKL